MATTKATSSNGDLVPAPTTEIARFPLPAPIDAGTPENTVKGEALLNSVIVLRGIGRRIITSLGPCRAIFFQFPHDYETTGPVRAGVNRDRDDNDALYATFPDGEETGVWQFLVSESSPACRVARELMQLVMESNGLAGRVAVMRARRSQTNAGHSYYVLDRPADGDLYADRSEVVANSLP